MVYTIQYGHTKDVHGIPIHRAPTRALCISIDTLQDQAKDMGIAIALPTEYDSNTITRAMVELSEMTKDEI